MANEYTPPTPPGQDIALSLQQIANALDGIRYSNDAIRKNTEGLSGMLAGHSREKQQTSNYTQFEDINSEQTLSPERQAYEIERKRIATIHAKNIQATELQAFKTNPKKRMELLKQAGLVNAQGKVTVGGKEYTTETVNKAFETGNQPDLIRILNETIAQEIQKTVAEQTPGKIGGILTAIEDAGIRQLKYGELPLQDILRAAGTLAGKAYEKRYGGEQGQPIGNIGKSLAAAYRILPVMGQAVAVGEVAGRTLKNIYENTFNDWYREPTKVGQLTGQGWLAGLQAKFTQPFSLFQPFGMIDWKTAEEIVQQTREQGFTGGQAGRVEQGMATIISKLGIQVGQAAEFFSTSMREGGMSVQDVVAEMKKFHDAAYNLNMNINDYTAQILQNTDTLRAEGAGKAAPGLAQALTAAAPVGYRTGEGQKAFQQIFGAAKGYIAATIGGGANVLNLTSQRYIHKAYSAFDQLMQNQIAFAEASLGPGATPNDIATYLSEVGPYTKGVSVDFLQNYINQARRGRGVTSALNFQRQGQLFSERLSLAREGPGGKLNDTQRLMTMTDEQLGRIGIHKHFIPGSGKGREGTWQYIGPTGQILSPDQYRETISAGFNKTAVDKARQELISSLGNTLTAQQRKELESANPFDVNKILTKIADQKGPKIGVGTSAGTVTIQLKDGIAQQLFTLQNERNKAVSSGAISANTLPSQRTWP